MCDPRGVGVFEHIMITVGQDGGRGIPVTNRRILKEGRGGANNAAQTFIWIVEVSTDQIRAIWSGIGTGGRGRKGLRRCGRIFEGEEGKGRKVGQGVGNAHSAGGGHVYMVAAVGRSSGTNIESARGMNTPGWAGEGGFVCIA